MPTTELEGKVAVVTGASRGIGRAAAAELAARGAEVVLVARHEDSLETAAAAIELATGRRAVVCAADLREPAATLRLTEVVEREFGHLDILVNNAGATLSGDLFATTDADWTDGFALKFFGYVRTSRSLWPLLATRRGSVVNVIGTSARSPSADFVIGGAVNAALTNFTKAVAQTGLRDGVRVNGVHPGPVLTDRLRAAHELPSSFVSNPEDCAQLIAFLVSPAADRIVGEIITIDGGMTSSL